MTIIDSITKFGNSLNMSNDSSISNSGSNGTDFSDNQISHCGGPPPRTTWGKGGCHPNPVCHPPPPPCHQRPPCRKF
ncbi:hypothetical protein DDB_G0275975 [Dictyostelium discoideum AX4]|uniref:Uncharacterized protein n=1 Tax=Dictyostelium discoideum TaxID=44689 RepID=Q552K8_DICDI|nr:hypothetical protein DDB_G0275975 [Dictyostelium discoideum AX4]EAL69444.1 hypothetical protein DDB_G0275975 [Dictyostelium discoideum AX4]|eukprot:XP_643374.1 hypothetical protein DDB_G0275975 [Dictyostelium discoideum AX4]